MVDDQHNTRVALWHTGTNQNGFLFEGGNGQFYLQDYFRFSNGSIVYKNKIDLQNSSIDSFSLTNTKNISVNQGGFFQVYDNTFSKNVIYYQQDGSYFLQSPSSSQLIDFIGNLSPTQLPIISGFDFYSTGIFVNGSRVVTESETGAFAIAATGSLTGIFYPLNSNPNSYQSSTGIVSGQDLVSNRYGYGAGIYTFLKGINSGQTGNVFSVQSQNGTNIFSVTINCSTNGFNIAKYYTVAAQSGQTTPKVVLTVDTGPFGNNNFIANFSITGTTGILMKINNAGIVSGDFMTTLFLGGTSVPVIINRY